MEGFLANSNKLELSNRKKRKQGAPSKESATMHCSNVGNLLWPLFLRSKWSSPDGISIQALGYLRRNQGVSASSFIERSMKRSKNLIKKSKNTKSNMRLLLIN